MSQPQSRPGPGLGWVWTDGSVGSVAFLYEGRWAGRLPHTDRNLFLNSNWDLPFLGGISFQSPGLDMSSMGTLRKNGDLFTN